jgi:hypothetical protein
VFQHDIKGLSHLLRYAYKMEKIQEDTELFDCSVLALLSFYPKGHLRSIR